MGSTVEANCSCGMKTQVDIGCGMADLGQICLFPFRCKDCNSVVTADVLAQKPVCETCQSQNVESYASESLCAEPGETVVASWCPADLDELELTDGRYLCPACSNPTLRFSGPVLLWD